MNEGGRPSLGAGWDESVIDSTRESASAADLLGLRGDSSLFSPDGSHGQASPEMPPPFTVRRNEPLTPNDGSEQLEDNSSGLTPAFQQLRQSHTPTPGAEVSEESGLTPGMVALGQGRTFADSEETPFLATRPHGGGRG
eukprot:CAMPEP_0194591566 /NCGR_PEP_ID=MMETSP0292-20121207/22156_1 /TAXON_ID=39354 /ORGANISM="Heterosigma akashiwo, Strain CCMP2393" /LENGTH=138 /DNA_ID=CAMNT_0039449693 /DNA_START=205 /DNA_END=618 /DNA_ORIENTATION=+